MAYRATFICGGECVPASRFRVHPIEAGLRSDGWSTDLVHGYGAWDQQLSSPFVRRAYRATCRLKRAAYTATVKVEGPVMVQRLAWPWWAKPEVRLGKHCSGLVFDFDDAVFLGGDGRPSSSRRKALSDVFSAARHVVAGNSWLAEAVDADVPVTVLPTCIDTGKYVPGRGLPNRVPVIGWIGTSGNFPYLRQLVEPLEKLRASGQKFDFVLCSDVRPDALLTELGARFVKWSHGGELAFLQSLDVGVMPLEDSDWCRGKCSFKLIQYMAVGCPVVASAVGFNRDVVRDGEVGFLVRKGDWLTPLSSLLKSSRLRSSFSVAARQRAVSHYDASLAIAAYKKMLGELQ